MTKEQIIEGNKLIAEFMGVKRQPVLYGSRRIRLDVPAVGTWFEDRGLQYHTSWDWLMPVVEKIEKDGDDQGQLVGVVIHFNRCSIAAFNLANLDLIKVGDTKIEAAWLAVVEFIKWYNQNQTIKQ